MNKPHLVPILCLLSTSLRKGLFLAATTALATSLAALSLAGPASAAKAPPIPTLTDTAVDMGRSNTYNPTFTGQANGVVYDPNTGKIYASDYHAVVYSFTNSDDIKQDVNIDPDLAVIYTVDPLSPKSTLIAEVVDSNCTPPGVTIESLAIDVSTQSVFEPCNYQNQVTVINELTNGPVAKISVPTPWTVLADNGTLYVSSYASSIASGAGTIYVINEKTNIVTTTIPVGHYPDFMALDTKNKQLFVSNYSDASVSVINTKTNTVKTTIKLAGAAGLAFDSKTEKLYVSDYFNTPGSTVNWGSVYVIDAKTLNVVTNIPTPNGCDPYDSVADSAHGTVYVLCYGVNFANGFFGLVIDEATETVAGTFNTMPNPRALALDPINNRLFVAANVGQLFGGASFYNTNQ